MIPMCDPQTVVNDTHKLDNLCYIDIEPQSEKVYIGRGGKGGRQKKKRVRGKQIRQIDYDMEREHEKTQSERGQEKKKWRKGHFHSVFFQ